ncbi:MAG: bacillithiol biosynthesis cysteine-adding enzyme BshC, partial [Bacteroidota bacterium]
SEFKINRPVLVDTLKRQYATLTDADLVVEQIDSLLADNTFTVTTAHQPSLFTGPLYFVYKIISTIVLAEQLRAKYPEQQFVPVFVIGGEDHDFEEVNHLHLFNKTISWESGESGAVGQMNTESLQPVLAELKDLLGNSESAEKVYQLIHASHTQHSQYGKAVQAMVHELFHRFGLVVLNMNDRALKQLFVPLIKEEVLRRRSKALVEKMAASLESLGFGQQATAREINFFYLKDQLRSRIVFEEGQYQVLDTPIRFSEAQMIQEIEQYPERFSPNVIMRPLYQELILPNLAYIGGGGELAYWMERPDQFAAFGLNFPMLIRRNSVMWLDKNTVKKLKKLKFDLSEIFEDTEVLVKRLVNRKATNSLSLAAEKKALNALFEGVIQKTRQIDPTLVKTAAAEQSKQIKSLEQLEGRLIRAEKQKHEVAIKQLRNLKEKLFPSNGLQERHDNFLSLYLKYGDAFFDTLKKHLNPLEKGFIVIVDEA